MNKETQSNNTEDNINNIDDVVNNYHDFNNNGINENIVVDDNSDNIEDNNKQDNNKNNNKDNDIDGEIENEFVESDIDDEFVELDFEGEELSGKDIVKNLRNKIKKLEIEKQEYLNSWQRALADYKNREKQIAEEKKSWGDVAVKRFVEDLLVVMDTYDAARSNKTVWESVDSNWRSGIEYIFQTFENKLSEKGFEKFANIGDVFDPSIHEGLGVVKSEDSGLTHSGNIAQVVMSGYKYKSELFRPAKVKVWE